MIIIINTIIITEICVCMGVQQGILVHLHLFVYLRCSLPVHLNHHGYLRDHQELLRERISGQ